MTPPDSSLASAPAASPPRAPSGKSRRDVEVVEYDRFIDERIRRTRRMIKTIDVAKAVMLLAAGWIVLLIGAAVVEHWVVPGGLTDGGRYALFGAAAVASIGLLAARLTPIVTRRVNPLYAADAIEQTTPSLKNSLVNLLQLRGDGSRPAPTALREELEREAAERIVGAEGDAAVDRGGVIRLGYVIIGLLVAMVAYAAVSPKSLFATAARVLAPWAEIAAPTRVRIIDLAPGDGEFAQGEFATVTARITGLEADEQAWLVSSTADRQQREQRAPFPSVDGGLNHQVRLPGSGVLGLQQDVAYRIEAGDARTRPFRLRVITAPTIVIRSVRYDYPEYTGYLDREALNTGDIRAIEGTKVEVTAVANMPIDSAQVDLGADGRPDLRMRVDGKTAVAEFTLTLRDDRQTPMQPSYVLRMTTTDGRTNSDPATHRIEVLPDLAPEVEITDPPGATRDLRTDETAVIRLRARDPDFGLGEVRLRAVRDDRGFDLRAKELISQALLKRPTEGRFDGVYRFTPRDYGLQPGDVVSYQVIATDTRQPNPNRAETSVKRFRIVGAGDGAAADAADEESARGEGGQPGDGTQKQGDQGGQESNGGQESAEPGAADQGSGEQGSPAGDSAGGGTPEQPSGSRDASRGERAEDSAGSESQPERRPEESSDGGSDSGAGGIKGEEVTGGENAADGD
ncbi:MAG: hypothetical protein AAF596_08610, partial [Planctomycetota bacterium]